jgi:hypothetical protein
MQLAIVSDLKNKVFPLDQNSNKSGRKEVAAKVNKERHSSVGNSLVAPEERQAMLDELALSPFHQLPAGEPERRETVVDNTETTNACRNELTMEERESMLNSVARHEPAANILKEAIDDTAADVGAEIHSSYVFWIIWCSLFVRVLDTTGVFVFIVICYYWKIGYFAIKSIDLSNYFKTHTSVQLFLYNTSTDQTHLPERIQK